MGPDPYPLPHCQRKEGPGAQSFHLILVYKFSLQASEPQPYLPWMYGIMYLNI